MDPVDELLLGEAADVLGRHREGRLARITVVDAPGTATGASDWSDQVIVHCDALTAERSAAATGCVVEADPASALTGARLVLLALPKALAALDEWCELIRAHADPDVQVVAGARIKHLRREMNEVLTRHFDDVHASLGRRKARVLHADGLRSPGFEVGYPRRSRVTLDLPGGQHEIDLLDHGPTFARGRVDAGTRLLLSTLDSWPTDAGDVVDLGCGDGVLAVIAARRLPGASVLATDDSASACRSATATAAANGVTADCDGVGVEVHRADGLTARSDASADLIVTNPPFHQGTTKDSTPAMSMLADSARVLRPGGQLWTVFNAHLPYLPLLRSRVGTTRIVARDRHYLVTQTVRGD